MLISSLLGVFYDVSLDEWEEFFTVLFKVVRNVGTNGFSENLRVLRVKYVIVDPSTGYLELIGDYTGVVSEGGV